MWSGESVMPVSTPHSMYVSVIHRQPMAFPYLLASARAADDDAGKALCSSSRVSCYRSVVRVASGDNLLLSCKRGLRNNWVNKRKSKGRRLSLPYSSSESTGANSKALKPTRVHYNMFKQVLPKVIWEECVATPHGRECTCPLRVLLAVQCPLQTSPITWPRVR